MKAEIAEKNETELSNKIRSVYKVVDENLRFANIIHLRIKSNDGKIFNEILSFSSLVRGNTEELSRISFEHNLLDTITSKKLRQLAELIIQAAQTSAFLVTSEGYHRIVEAENSFDCFVFGGKLYWLGSKPEIRVILSSSIASSPRPTCTLVEWDKKIGRYVWGNPYLVCIACAAFCSLLTRWLGFHPVILWIVGGSSVGKTTGQKCIQSFSLPGDSIQDTKGTELGLRAKLAKFRDSPAFLQEARQAGNPASLINLIFDVANQGTRVISTSTQQVSESQKLTCGLIFSNERSIEELAVGRKVEFDAGLGARLFQLSTNAPHGIFHNLPSGLSARALSEKIVALSNRYYGAVWQAYVPAVANNSSNIKKWKNEKFDRIYELITENIEITDQVSERLLRGVAAWAFAGCVASQLKIVPATNKQIIAAFQLIVREYVARLKTGSTPIGDQVIERVRDLIDRNPGKFPLLSDSRSEDQNGSYGYRRVIGDRVQYLFFPPVLNEQIGEEFGLRFILSHLRKCGYLISNKDGEQLIVRMPGKEKQLKRFYVIDGAIRYERQSR